MRIISTSLVNTDNGLRLMWLLLTEKIKNKEKQTTNLAEFANKYLNKTIWGSTI